MTLTRIINLCNERVADPTLSGEARGHYGEIAALARAAHRSNVTLIEELVSQCEAYHSALDEMFARMSAASPSFFPSKSGQPWEACLKGNELIKRARAALT